MNNLKIDIYTKKYELKYNNFLHESKDCLFYHSLKYRTFLKKIIKYGKPLYLIAVYNNKIIGIFPLFILKIKNKYSIINSLPFYGSHGGIIISRDFVQKKKIVDLFVQKLFSIVTTEKCLSLNIIDNPFFPMSNFYENIFKVSASDYRLSHITNLSIDENHEKGLLGKFKSRRRNYIRNAFKENFKLTNENTYDGFKKIYYYHKMNQESMGRKAKPLYVFKALHDTFVPNLDYDIYFAKKNNEYAGGLLIFYYKNFVEYFTPVYNLKHSKSNPLNFLIFSVMKIAAKKGIQFWNWGGTWPSKQQGLRRFKKSWGAEEKRYNYYTKVFDNENFEKNIEFLKENSDFFYLKKFQ